MAFWILANLSSPADVAKLNSPTVSAPLGGKSDFAFELTADEGLLSLVLDSDGVICVGVGASAISGSGSLTGFGVGFGFIFFTTLSAGFGVGFGFSTGFGGSGFTTGSGGVGAGGGGAGGVGAGGKGEAAGVGENTFRVIFTLFSSDGIWISV